MGARGAGMVEAIGAWWGAARRWPTVAKVQEGQEGFSLPEELVSLGILAFAFGIILATMYTGTLGVKANQDRVSGAALGRSQMELVMDASYRPGPPAAPYPTVAPQSGDSAGTGGGDWAGARGAVAAR